MTDDTGVARGVCAIAYLDNNATTIMPPCIRDAMMEWTNRGNPSSAYAMAKHTTAMIHEFSAMIAKRCGCDIDDYAIVPTSGASESNSAIIFTITEHARMRGSPFHVIVSSIEHKSVMLAIDIAVLRCGGLMSVTYIKPTQSGHIMPDDVAAAIRPNTVLVCVMHANNETGAVNNIAAIGRAIAGRAFFHSDIVQTFGKIATPLHQCGVDGASISFHKIHGPPGVGAMILRSAAFVAGFIPTIFGTQNAHMRGGTENVPGIGAAVAAMRMVFRTADETRIKECALKKYLIEQLSARAPLLTYDKYLASHTKLEMQIVLIARSIHILLPEYYLPGTLVISAVKHAGPPACNSMIREKLEEAGVIVSVGSACNAGSTDRSHVLRAMGVPDIVMDGAIRVSMCGFTTREEIDRFVNGFIREALRQYRVKKT